MKHIKIRPSDNSLLLWLYKKSGQGSILGTVYKVPLGYYGLKVPRDNNGSIIYPGNEIKVKRQSALYIIKASPFEPLGWGIGSLPCVTSRGEATTVGVNGTFSFSVELPQLLYEEVADMGDKVFLESFREKIVSLMGNEIINSFNPNTVKQLNEVSKSVLNCQNNIAAIFESFGLKLKSFVIEGTV